ncbi:hypothetical protein P692DRAFT_20882340 [Suillus brevipes Sb2]|nr:hypothetical protein P692DRAFT_20882340 [Suillus brevipes Sb2]
MSAYNNSEADTDGVATDGDEESGKPLSFAPAPVRNSVVVTVGDKNTLVSTAQSQRMPPMFARIHQFLVSTAQSESNVAVALPSHRSDATKTTPTTVDEAPNRHHSGDVTAGDKETSVSTAHRSDKPKEATYVCNDTSASTAQSKSNIAVAPRPCRSAATKSYTHDHSDGAESSPSDSDWAADEEKRKKAARPSAVDGDDNGDDPPPSPLRLTHEGKGKGKAKKGRLPLEAVSKAQELGRTTVEAAKALGIEYGKKDIKAWKEEQAAHYKAHPYKDPKHAALWQKIQEYWDGSLAGATEDLTS